MTLTELEEDSLMQNFLLPLIDSHSCTSLPRGDIIFETRSFAEEIESVQLGSLDSCFGNPEPFFENRCYQIEQTGPHSSLSSETSSEALELLFSKQTFSESQTDVNLPFEPDLIPLFDSDFVKPSESESSTTDSWDSIFNLPLLDLFESDLDVSIPTSPASIYETSQNVSNSSFLDSNNIYQKHSTNLSTVSTEPQIERKKRGRKPGSLNRKPTRKYTRRADKQVERPIELNCPYENCNKVYYKTSHLKAHERRHTGEKPFICPWNQCPWRFSRSDELGRHYRSHTGDKPYECTTCHKRFARSDHLSKHRKVHERSKDSADFYLYTNQHLETLQETPMVRHQKRGRPRNSSINPSQSHNILHTLNSLCGLNN